MSHWNYRVMARRDQNDVRFEFYEVYYDDNNKPNACSQNPIYPTSFISDIEDPIKSLKWHLNAMRLSCNKPILDYDRFPNEYVKHLRKIKLKNINKILNRKK